MSRGEDDTEDACEELHEEMLVLVEGLGRVLHKLLLLLAEGVWVLLES